VSVTSDFLYLFRGNRLVAGVDDTGHGNPGPLRLDPLNLDRHWTVLAEGHLTDVLGIGVYPYDARREAVRWGCVDFDEGEYDSWAHALNLRETLHSLGIEPWIERSRSKGYHVWIFSEEWVPAQWMRRLLVGSCEVVGAPSREVNPKSNHLEPGQLGNFVRLPYKGYVVDRQITRQVVVDLMGTPLSMELFIAEALLCLTTAAEVERVANTLWVPPEARERPRKAREGPWIERLGGLARVQLEEGPKEDHPEGRSGFLFAFGMACAESGLDEDEISAAVRTADEIHTHKYEGRRDADTRYEEIARKAIDAMA
jgi:hypothetical protein